MQNIIDLASERRQRQELAQRASKGAEHFAVGLQRAGESLANLAWVLAAPVRHHDQELKTGIYEAALTRLNKIVTVAVIDIDHAPDIKSQFLQKARDVAFTSFQMRLLILAAEESHEPMSSG